MQRADGPHPSGPPPVANRPTLEEIIDLQSVIAAAIGVKGSDLRQKANKLAKLGMIALEEALGFALCDRFGGALPSSEDAIRFAKRAVDKLPKAKQKAKWREKARVARKVAREAGAAPEAVEAVGRKVEADARDHFCRSEVDLGLPQLVKPVAPAPPIAPPTKSKPTEPMPPPPEPVPEPASLSTAFKQPEQP